MFKSDLRKQALEQYNETVERYEKKAAELNAHSEKLYEKRDLAMFLISKVESKINALANSPKEFEVILNKTKIETGTFNDKKAEILKAEKEAKKAGLGTGAGATVSTLGLAVATMGPTAAMGIATTFGTASTGTAISALTGAAANNAALAWLGGGAIASGGGGMTAGSLLLGLAGPVGWGLAGTMLTASVGTGLYANHKNEKAAKAAAEERLNLEKAIQVFNGFNAEVNALINITHKQMKCVYDINKQLKQSDYNTLSNNEKIQAGVLVNSTLTLAELINKEVNLDD